MFIGKDKKSARDLNEITLIARSIIEGDARALLAAFVERRRALTSEEKTKELFAQGAALLALYRMLVPAQYRLVCDEVADELANAPVSQRAS
jgi:hypothetical protein